MVTTKRIFVTPAMAVKWYKTCEDYNRKYSKALVRKYAADMSAGKWKENGETIKISRSGILLDGQHRCRAIEMSGVSQWMQVAFEVEEEDRDTIDIGKKRTMFDMLRINGMKASTAAAAALSVVIKLKRTPIDDTPISSEDLCLAYKVYGEEIEEACKEASSLVRKGGGKCANAFQSAAYFIMKSTHDEAEVAEFFDKLYAGVGVSKKENYGAVRGYFNAEKNSIQRATDHHYKMLILVRLWNNDTTRHWKATSGSDQQYLSTLLDLITL